MPDSAFADTSLLGISTIDRRPDAKVVVASVARLYFVLYILWNDSSGMDSGAVGSCGRVVTPDGG